jgi:hypothetical protein
MVESITGTRRCDWCTKKVIGKKLILDTQSGSYFLFCKKSCKEKMWKYLKGGK